MFKNWLSTNRSRTVHNRDFSVKSTVNPEQTRAFEILSKKWNREGEGFKLLRAMNFVRVPWIQNRLTEIGIIKQNTTVNELKPLQGISILDVGCGVGIFAKPLSFLGASVTGLDCNSEMLKVANLHKQNEDIANLKYILSTVEEHAVAYEEKYDVVIASETIEHVSEQELFVKSCIKCLKPGGSFFLTTNSKSQSSKFFFITLKEDILRHLPKGTHVYEMFIDIEDVKDMLKKENCEISFTSGIIYNPFTNKWYWIKNHRILHYAVHAIKRENTVD
ncbi:ubiquinone biosynthesis O-methyltransferase, mitochondrial-like [Zophobas morio]|uniref:ubiquinone biosynthesis O-methyltransferase, mitochondrial-like n=1 Tax=Zophobas morio TaxID=2755281 RepID=UPI003082E564